jgi:hypothetical protein
MRREAAARLVVLSGVLLLLDLMFGFWYDDVVAGISFERTAIEPPQGWLAVLAWLATAALVAEVVLARVSHRGLPHLAVPWETIEVVQGAAVLGLVVLKVLVSGSVLWGAWLGVVLAGALAYGAWAANHEPATRPGGGGRHERQR